MTHIATKSRAGLMAPAHVQKLNGIEPGAQVNPGNATPASAGLMSASDKSKLDGIATGANVTNASTVGSAIHGSSAKATPVDADTVALIDSAASNALKKLSWSNIKATLKSYFDTLYATVGHTHSNANTSSAGFMSASDKSKLDGIQAQATKNDTDANLKNRANHTGTQSINTISGLQDALDSKLDLTGGTMTGRLEIPETTAAGAMLNISPGTEGPDTPIPGDVWISDNTLYFRGTSATRALGSTGALSTVSQAEAEAGTASTTRAWTAQRVNQAIQALSPVKSVAGKTGAVTLSTSDVNGLGNSATCDVGTTSGTVAAGDDSRIVGAVQKAGDAGLGFFQSGVHNLGTSSGLTIKPALTTSNFKFLVNNGAFTLQAPDAGNYTMAISVLNSIGAGAMTATGFTEVTGTFSTTPNKMQRLLITAVGSGIWLDIVG